jgi:hypothetical protein
VKIADNQSWGDLGQPLQRRRAIGNHFNIEASFPENHGENFADVGIILND